MKKSKVNIGSDVGLYYAPYIPKIHTYVDKSVWDFPYEDKPLVVRIFNQFTNDLDYIEWLNEHSIIHQTNDSFVHWYTLYELPDEETKLEFILRWG